MKRELNKKRDNFISLRLVFLILIIFFSFYLINLNITGDVIFNLNSPRYIGEILDGNFVLSLNDLNSYSDQAFLRARLGEQVGDIPLNVLISENTNLSFNHNLIKFTLISYTSNDFLENSSEPKSEAFLQENYSDIKNNSNLDNYSDIKEDLNLENNSFDLSRNNSISQEESYSNKSSEENTTLDFSEIISLTGGIVNEGYKEIFGQIFDESPFIYNKDINEHVELVSGSVKVDNISFPDEILIIEIKDNTFSITPNYTILNSLQNNSPKNIKIPLSLFNLSFEQGDLNFSIIDHEKENLIFSYPLNFNESEFQEQIKFSNQSSFNQTYLNQTNLNQTDILNQTFLNQTLSNQTNTTIQTIQYQARIGEPVKWKKIVNKSEDENVIIELPQDTFNISVKKIEDRVKEEVAEQNIQIFGITGNVALEYKDKPKSFNIFQRFFAFLGISGNVIEEANLTNETTFENETAKILEGNTKETFSNNFIQVEITDNSTNLEIEYYTEAPTAKEIDLTNGKQIIVSAPDEFNYKNILAYTEINERILLTGQNKISLYWITNETQEHTLKLDNETETQTKNQTSEIPLQRVKVTFTPVDADEDGFIDYIEWIVPHLSNQTYELIIKIKDAEHLDENKTFIEDIYEYVKEKDNNWTTVPDNHYLRLKFENNLTSSRDITLYARSSNENSSRIEVYETNQTQLITVFENITNQSYYKIYLTNLTTSQDSFDLRVINSVDFDFVIDPIDSITINYPTNISDNLGSNITINVSITGSSVDSCLASLNGQANVTMLLNLDKTLGNYTYTFTNSGYNNLTVYCKDTSNNIFSSRLTNFYVNLPPNVTSIILTPASLDKNQNLVCNFTIIDDNPKIIWAGTNRPSSNRITSVNCDNYSCYAVDDLGYFLKINKTSGIHIYNRTTGYINQLGTSSVFGLECDNDFCYAIDTSGYFLKINKTSGIHIYNRTTGYTNRLTTNYYNYNLECDNDFCYALDGEGYFLKINKTSGIHIYNRTTGYINQLGISSSWDLNCDNDFCYAGDFNGYFLKINKTSGIHIYNRTTGYTNQLTTDNNYNLECDNDFCYAIDTSGYFLKINKTSGIHIYNRTTGYINQLGISSSWDLNCDNDFCYAGDFNGYFLKINKTSGIHIYNRTTGYTNRISDNLLSNLNCDENFCYVGDYYGYFLKINKNFGDVLFANITWYKNNIANLSYQVDLILNNVSKNTSLLSQNFTRYDNWSCSVTPYDTKSYGVSKNSTTSFILNSPSKINFLNVDPPFYPFSFLRASSSFDDSDNDTATLFFKWYVNGINVENDTFTNVANNTIVYTFLNSSLSPGDLVNITISNYDGFDNSSVFNLKNSLTNHTILLKGSLGFNGVGPMFCEKDFCYAISGWTNLVKINKLNFNVTYFDYKEYSQIRDIECDYKFCYMSTSGGYFLKFDKLSQSWIYNMTNGYKNQLSSSQINALECDDNFCYAIDGNGYFLKINKTSGVHIYNRTTGYTNQLTTTGVYTLDCDTNFCYAGDSNGYFLKINKTSGVHIYNRTTGYTNQLTTSLINSLYCDDNFCYAFDDLGYFLKINKTSGIHIYNITTGYTNQVGASSIGLNCENEFCYAVSYSGYFLKINKTSGIHIYNTTTGFDRRITSNSIYSLDCDEDFCYTGSNDNHFYKILKQDLISIKPVVSFNFTNPTYLNNTLISSDNIPFNLSFDFIRPLNVNITLYNSSSFFDSIFLENTSNLEYFSGNFTSLNDGVYYLNGSIGYEKGVNGLIETRKITLDNAAPIFLNKPIYDIEEGVSVNLSIPFFDTSPISLWEVNDTTHFSISSSGILTNKTAFSKGENYTLNITATDVIGYKNSTSLTINTIKASNSSIGLNLLFPLSNFSVSQNKTFVVGVNVSCSQEDCGEIQVSLNPRTDNVSNLFYSLNENPAIFNLSLGESKIVSWRINTTGAKGDSVFFVYVNKTSRMFTSNITRPWSVSISNIQDNVLPKLSIIYPNNNSFFNSSRINISYSVYDTNLQTCWYSNDSFNVNTTLFNCENLTSLIWPEGNHNLIIWAEDINNNINHTSLSFTIDTSSPSINFSSQNLENMSLVNSNLTIYSEISDVNLANLSLNWNGNISYFNLSSPEIISLGGNNYLFVHNKIGVLPNTTYFYQVGARDLANNQNFTELRFVKGDSAPTYVSIYQNPDITDYDLLDPFTNFSVYANISDIDNNFENAILQWKNSTMSDWENISMENLTPKNYYTLVQGDILSFDYEGNITYRIISKDILNKSTISNNYTIQNFWDCSWKAYLTSSEVAGWSENKGVTNLIINNTGDANYGENNCSLLFHVSHNLNPGRIYFNNNYNNRWQRYYDTSFVEAKSILNIPINVSFLDSISEEESKIEIGEVMQISNKILDNLTLTILSNKEGPYFYQEIDSYPLYSIDLTSNTFDLSAYLRNLMGDSSENNTAYNVSFYFNLPQELTLMSGNSSLSFENISNNLPVFLNSEIGFKNLALATPGTKTIYLHSFGYNYLGELVKEVNNQSLLNNSITLLFNCYNISDGVYVTACGSLDGDYVAPVIQAISAQPVGGGVGGGGISSSNLLEKKADYEFVRGKTQEIKVLFNNEYNSSLANLEFSLKGNLSKYIQIIPSKITSLPPFSQKEIILKIVSPGFIPLGKQVLFLYINGKIGENNYNEKREITLQINELSKQEALAIVNQTNSLIENVITENLSLSKLQEFNNTIHSSFEDLDFNTLKESYKELEKIVDSALTSKTLLEELNSLIELSSKQNIEVPKTKRLVNLAKLSFERQEFEESFARLRDAQIAFALETNGISPSIFYYFKYKPLESIGLILILFLSLTFSFKFTQSLLLKNKIRKLKHEEKIIMDLIKDSQRKTFFEKKMDLEEYHQSIEYFEKRLSEIEQNLIDSQKRKEYIFKLHSKEASLKSEKMLILDKIKEIQDRYLKKKMMDRKIYDILLESYNTRLNQLEEAIAGIETKRLLKKEFKTINKKRKNEK